MAAGIDLTWMTMTAQSVRMLHNEELRRPDAVEIRICVEAHNAGMHDRDMIM